MLLAEESRRFLSNDTVRSSRIPQSLGTHLLGASHLSMTRFRPRYHSPKWLILVFALIDELENHRLQHRHQLLEATLPQEVG